VLLPNSHCHDQSLESASDHNWALFNLIA